MLYDSFATHHPSPETVFLNLNHRFSNIMLKFHRQRNDKFNDISFM